MSVNLLFTPVCLGNFLLYKSTEEIGLSSPHLSVHTFRIWKVALKAPFTYIAQETYLDPKKCRIIIWLLWVKPMTFLRLHCHSTSILWLYTVIWKMVCKIVNHDWCSILWRCWSHNNLPMGHRLFNIWSPSWNIRTDESIFIILFSY